MVSFIVDHDPIFAYMGWHLVHSLHDHGAIPWQRIHVQFTKEVPEQVVGLFASLGCSAHRLERFGDGKYCNKLAQWESLRTVSADHFLFLDTDVICVADPAHMLPGDSIAGKVVDFANPSVPVLDEVFGRAGFSDRPSVVQVEATDDRTYLGNCNGGVYSIPARYAEPLFEAWRRRALALLADIEPLRMAGKDAHVDQIAFCMAIHETGLPFQLLPSNLNYYLHTRGEHRYRDASEPLMLLHYHNSSLNVLGLIEPASGVAADEAEAVSKANDSIRANFNNRLFWNFRYRHFEERGSGVGSRGENLEYKRALLVSQGIEQAASVLDVGCGDLYVVRDLDLKGYVGLDRVPESLRLAKAARPDWSFVQAPCVTAPADFVLCFEVAIHQETEKEYRDLINFISEMTRETLIVSGYDGDDENIRNNHMIFFYEPLRQSLADTNRFRSITEIGRHSDVVIYRCEVG